MNGKKIIVAYDGSPDSNKALKLAAEMAQALSAEIKLVTVIESFLCFTMKPETLKHWI